MTLLAARMETPGRSCPRVLAADSLRRQRMDLVGSSDGRIGPDQMMALRTDSAPAVVDVVVAGCFDS